MKTNRLKLWIGKTPLCLLCLAITVATVFAVWAGCYCYRNRDKTRTVQPNSQQVPVDMTISEFWLPVR